MELIKKTLSGILPIFIVLVLIALAFSPMVSANNGNVFGNGELDSAGGAGTSIITNAINDGNQSASRASAFRNVDGLNNAIGNYTNLVRWAIGFLSTLGTITSFLILALAFVRLANSPTSAFQKREVYIDIMKGVICTVAFGGLTLLMTVFYKTFSMFIQNTIMLSSDWRTAFTYALVEYKYLICGVMGVLSLTLFVLFLKDVTMLGATSTNPRARAEAMKKVVVTLAASIGMGGTGVFVAIFNGLIQF